MNTVEKKAIGILLNALSIQHLAGLYLVVYHEKFPKNLEGYQSLKALFTEDNAAGMLPEVRKEFLKQASEKIKEHGSVGPSKLADAYGEFLKMQHMGKYYHQYAPVYRVSNLTTEGS